MRFSKQLIMSCLLLLTAPNFIGCKARGAGPHSAVKDMGPNPHEANFERMELTVGGSFSEGYPNPDAPTEPSVKLKQTLDIRSVGGSVKEIRLTEVLEGDSKGRGATANQSVAFVSDWEMTPEHKSSLEKAGFRVLPLEKHFQKARCPNCLGILTYQTKDRGPNYSFTINTSIDGSRFSLGGLTYESYKLGNNRNSKNQNFVLSVAQAGSNVFETKADIIESKEVRATWYDIEEYTKELKPERSNSGNSEKITVSPNDIVESGSATNFGEFEKGEIDLATDYEKKLSTSEYKDLKQRSFGFGTISERELKRLEVLEKELRDIEAKFKSRPGSTAERWEKAKEFVRGKK